VLCERKKEGQTGGDRIFENMGSKDARRCDSVDRCLKKKKRDVTEKLNDGTEGTMKEGLKKQGKKSKEFSRERDNNRERISSEREA